MRDTLSNFKNFLQGQTTRLLQNPFVQKYRYYLIAGLAVLIIGTGGLGAHVLSASGHNSSISQTAGITPEVRFSNGDVAGVATDSGNTQNQSGGKLAYTGHGGQSATTNSGAQDNSQTQSNTTTTSSTTSPSSTTSDTSNNTGGTSTNTDNQSTATPQATVTATATPVPTPTPDPTPPNSVPPTPTPPATSATPNPSLKDCGNGIHVPQGSQCPTIPSNTPIAMQTCTFQGQTFQIPANQSCPK